MIRCQKYPSMRCMVTTRLKLPLIDNSRKILDIDTKSITKRSLLLYNYSDYIMQISDSPFSEKDTLGNICFMTRFRHLWEGTYDKLIKEYE